MSDEIQYKTNTGDQIDPKLFETYQTGTTVDQIWSDDDGIMRGMTVIVIGDPGVGKTTVVTDLASRLRNNNPQLKTMFVSGEEGELDRAYAEQKHSSIVDLPTMFPRSYANPADAMFKAFSDGWDIVVIDSFKVLQDMIATDYRISSRQAEKRLLSELTKISTTGEPGGKYTTFLCIQQVTTDGSMRGSNDIKHDTTATLEFRFDGPSSRYLTFSKNRRAGAMVGQRVYYDLLDNELMYSDLVDPNNPDKKLTSKPNNSSEQDSSKHTNIFNQYNPSAASKFRSRLGKKKRR